MSFCEVFTVLYVATAIEFCSNVMNHDSDSVNVGRLWHGGPQPSGGANIIRCFWCLALLMNYQRRWYEWNGAQHPWSPMEKWNGAQPASMESHGDVVRRSVSYHVVPLRALCGDLSATMEYHGELEPVNTHGVPCRVFHPSDHCCTSPHDV